MRHATDINYPESGGWTRKNIRIVGETHPAVMVNTKILAMNMEPVEVGIAPIHHDLNRIVEIGHRAVAKEQADIARPWG